jgi:hypothetical protein
MNDTPLRLFDILPMANHSSSLASVFLISLTVVFTLSIVVWHRYFTQLSKLKRALDNQSIPPRQICHQLAEMMTDEAFLQDLNQVRFQRSEPSLVDVQVLIKRARDVL